MIYVALVVAGLLLGLIVGRWWALIGAAALGIWIALASEVDEVPPAFLGAAYALLAGFGIAIGVALRHRPRRQVH